MLINKIDLLTAVDFDIDKVVEQVKKLNPGIEIFHVSAKTGNPGQRITKALFQIK